MRFGIVRWYVAGAASGTLGGTLATLRRCGLATRAEPGRIRFLDDNGLTLVEMAGAARLVPRQGPPVTFQYWASDTADILAEVNRVDDVLRLTFELDGVTLDEARAATGSIIWAAMTDVATISLAVIGPYDEVGTFDPCLVDERIRCEFLWLRPRCAGHDLITVRPGSWLCGGAGITSGWSR